MGWAEKMARESREVSEAKEAGLSLASKPDIAASGPSDWLVVRLREFGAALIHQSNGLAQAMNPSLVVGPDGKAGAQQINFPQAVLQNQLLMMRALSAMNDLLLVFTTGEGVLKPVGRKPENGGAPKPTEEAKG